MLGYGKNLISGLFYPYPSTRVGLAGLTGLGQLGRVRTG
jgi:hypothetical protein